MSTCAPTPVSTAFSTVIGNSITTTYSLSTSAVPPVVTTHVDSYCENEAVVLDSAVCLKTGTRTGTETLQAASDVVYTVTYETAVPFTSFVPINTFYGGCSDTPPNPGGNNPDSGSNPGPSSGLNSSPNNLGSNFNSGNNTNSGSNGNTQGPISVPPGHTLVTSSVLVYTTGPPTTSVIPSLMTLPNGQVTTTSILTVVTPKPSQVFVPTTTLVEATGDSDPGSASYGNLGVIIGAVIGGFVGLCLVILAWWYVRRRRKRAYDEILHEHEKQIGDQEARQQAIERSKDPTRRRDSDPKPTPYQYGSLLSGSRTQSSTSTGIALSQNPFERTGVGNRASYVAPSSPLLATVPVMGEFGANPGGVVGVFSGTHGIGSHDGARDPMNPSASSISNTSGSIHTIGSAPTLESDSGRSSGLDYLQPGGSADEFVEVDIGRPRVASPPPHLSMSFGSWNTNSSGGRQSGGSKRSSGVPGTDLGLGASGGEEATGDEEGRRRLLCPGEHRKHQRDTMEGHSTATLVQVEAAREDNIRSHLRTRSGSPVSWASPARGTLFIVNQRNSEDV